MTGVHGRATAAKTAEEANTEDSFLVSYGVGDQRSEVFVASLREVMAHFS